MARPEKFSLLLVAAALVACASRAEQDSEVTQSDALVGVAARWMLPGGGVTGDKPLEVVTITPPRGTTPALVVTRQEAGSILDKHAVLHALRADGSEIWSLDLGHPLSGHPGVAADGTIYATVAPCQSTRPSGSYVRDVDLDCAHAVVAIDPVTGAKRWHAPLTTGYPGGQTGKVLVNPANGDVYASANEGNSGPHLHAVHADGTPAWQRMFSEAQLVAPNGTAYVLDWRRSDLSALSPAGTKLWSADVGTITAPPALGPDGTIYLGDWNGKLLAFSQTGQSVFTRQVARTPLRGEPIVLADGSMVLRHDHGESDEILGLDPTGAKRWSIIEALPPVLGPNGAIFAARWRGWAPGEAVCAYDAVTGVKRTCSGDARIVPLASDRKLVYGAEYVWGRATSLVTLHDVP